MTRMPTWERRMRAPQLLTWTLSGPPVAWAAGAADRGALLATTSGRAEVYAFDASTTPAALVQLTNRPQGTSAMAVSPDGSEVFWFDDTDGDELGRWQRVPAAGGASTTLLADLPPAYGGDGLLPLRDGRVIVALTIDVQAPGDPALEVAVATPDGAGDVVYHSADPCELVDVTPDGSLALLNYAPGGDFGHTGMRVVRLDDGEVVHDTIDETGWLEGVAFDPTDANVVLFHHERGDRTASAFWDLTTGEQRDISSGLDGDVKAAWFSDGSSLLLTVQRDARHELYCYDRHTGEVTRIATPRGTVHASSARPDGSVHALMSSAGQPAGLVRCHDGSTTDLVVLPGEPPAPSRPAVDVFADGPGGRVHALFKAPSGGIAPYPTVFRIHGGPTSQDFDMWNDRDAAYVDAGYAVVNVNYRGSLGYGQAWRAALRGRLGFIELEDIAAIRSRLESDGVVDPERVSVVGISWGGYLTLMAVGTEPDRWRSGAAMVPVADFRVMAHDAPSFMGVYITFLLGGSLDDIPDVWRAASPSTAVDQVVAPLYVTGGLNDPRCPIRQTDEYVAKLRARDHDVRYERMDAGHLAPTTDTKVEEVRQILDFLARTLPVDTAPPSP